MQLRGANSPCLGTRESRAGNGAWRVAVTHSVFHGTLTVSSLRGCLPPTVVTRATLPALVCPPCPEAGALGQDKGCWHQR